MGGERRRVRARVAEGDERQRRRAVFMRVYPKLDEYGEFTDREFPVVVLESVQESLSDGGRSSGGGGTGDARA
jgi:hypothetical protein